MAARDVLAVLAGKRRVVDTEGHGDRRLLDLRERDGLDLFRSADRIADVQILDAGDGDNGTHLCLGHRNLLQTFEFIEGVDLATVVLGLIVVVDKDNVLADLDAAVADLADADAADIVVVVDRGDQDLGRSVGITDRRRNVLEDRIKQGLHGDSRASEIQGGNAALRGSEDERAV